MGNPYKTSGNLDLVTLTPDPGANVTASAVLHGGSSESVLTGKQEAQNQSHCDTIMNKEEDYEHEHVNYL